MFMRFYIISKYFFTTELGYVSIMSRPCKRTLCINWNYKSRLVTHLCVLYNLKICCCYQSWICIYIRSTPSKWTEGDPILAFLWLGNTFLYSISLLHWVIRFYTPSTYCIGYNTFLYSIHLLHLFCIKFRNNFYQWWMYYV